MYIWPGQDCQGPPGTSWGLVGLRRALSSLWGGFQGLCENLVHPRPEALSSKTLNAEPGRQIYCSWASVAMHGTLQNTAETLAQQQLRCSGRNSRGRLYVCAQDKNRDLSQGQNSS